MEHLFGLTNQEKEMGPTGQLQRLLQGKNKKMRGIGTVGVPALPPGP